MRSKCKTRSGIGVLSRDDGGRAESPEEVAEEFNKYFSSVFSSEDLESMPEVVGGRAGGELLDMVVSRKKVRSLLGMLRADKAPGVDELSPRLLLHFPDEILDPVCMLFEKSLREGRVPEDWRRANVVPIYKVGDRGKAKNYRPVSLTCQLCKLFEKLVRDDRDSGALGGEWTLEGNAAWVQEGEIMFDQFAILSGQGYRGAGCWRECGRDLFRLRKGL